MKYYLGKKVLLQKMYKISAEESILEYTKRNFDIDPRDAIEVVSVDGTLYELNLSAALVLEQLLIFQNTEEVSKILTEIFDVNQEMARHTVKTCIDTFISKGILFTLENGV